MAAPERKVKVAVVFGGRSSEHAISCLSASSVMRALDRERYDVLPIGIARDGRWVLPDADPGALPPHGRALPQVGAGRDVALRADPTGGEFAVVDPAAATGALATIDVVFPVLHGRYGEDGTVQGLLEIAGVPYVGAGVLGSAVALDKEYMKKLLAAEGLPVGDYIVVRAGEENVDTASRDRLGLPAFVKPARGGSSIGMTRLTDWSQLPAALAEARRTDPKVIVEAQILGREVECGVLEGEYGAPPDVSVPGEVRVVRGHDWYDFEAKYLDDACEFDIPAKLPEGVADQVQDLAARAFLALDGRGLARVDFFVGEDGTVTVNEVNTLPGFTEISLFGRAWEATGLPWREVVERLIRTALARGERGVS